VAPDVAGPDSPRLALASGTGPTSFVSGLAPEKCMTLEGGGTDRGTKLILSSCDGETSSQQFTWQSNGEIRARGLCLDAFGGQGEDRDPIVIWPCHGGANQRWSATADGEIRGINGKCVDVYEAGEEDGTPVILYSCHGGTNQQWETTGDGSPVVTPPSPERPPPSSGSARQPALPRAFVDTDYRAPTGKRISVRGGDDLQDALDAAAPGDEVVLEAGATFTGNFILKNKPGDGWITIRTSAVASLPAPGTRVSPSQARLMPKLVTTNSMPALYTYRGAHNYRIVGLEISAPTSLSWTGTLVAFGYGDSRQSAIEDVPHHLIVERSYIHGHTTLQLQRCIALNSAVTAVVDSYLSDCHGRQQDSQAIAGWTGPGPYKIVNNYLEGAGEIVMFGGSDPRIPNLIPSDIEIRRNHFTRPVSWKGVWTIKNFLELKNAQRVLVEGNVMENNWAGGQSGFALVFKSVNQSGRCTWCTVQDVTVQYNVIRRTVAGLALTSTAGNHRAVPAARIALRHNLMTEFDTLQFTGSSERVFQIGGKSTLSDVTIDHNTIAVVPDLLIAFSYGTTARLNFLNTVAYAGLYGAKGDRTPQGISSLETFAPGYTFEGNVIARRDGGSGYPSGNAYPDAHTYREMRLANGEVRMPTASRGTAANGRDPGVDVATLADKTAGVVQR
jgi:hypothetical protein